MRQPIQRQLLWPLVQVAILGSAVTGLLAAWMNVRSARLAEEVRLQQLASTLTDAGFPLTDAVLERMAKLSGAQFVTLNAQGAIQHGSDSLTTAEGEKLSTLPVPSRLASPAEHQDVELSNGTFRAIRIPVRTAVSPEALTLVILTSQQRWNDLAWRAALPPIIAGLLAASAAALFAVLLSQRFVARIRLLAARAADLAEGRFERGPLPPVDDELRDLAAALNMTGEKLQRYEMQIRSGERLNTLGRLGAGMAHQLRNAITGAQMALDLHAAELSPDVDRESLAVAVRQLALMEAYLQRFLTLGRGETPDLRDVDVAALVNEALQLVEPICRHHGIAVTWQPPGDVVRIRGDLDSLRQMLLNLLTNASEAVQPLPASERKIGVELLSAVDGVVCLRCWDLGPGPKSAIADKVFERFVTDKPDGTGLGLAVAQEIAQSHEGMIAWRREAGQTVFEVTLSKGSAKPQANGGIERIGM